MGFPILVRWHLYIKSGPSFLDTLNEACHLVAIVCTTTPVPSHLRDVPTTHLKIHCNDISHWLGASLESVLCIYWRPRRFECWKSSLQLNSIASGNYNWKSLSLFRSVGQSVCRLPACLSVYLSYACISIRRNFQSNNFQLLFFRRWVIAAVWRTTRLRCPQRGVVRSVISSCLIWSWWLSVASWVPWPVYLAPCSSSGKIR